MHSFGVGHTFFGTHKASKQIRNSKYVLDLVLAGDCAPLYFAVTSMKCAAPPEHILIAGEGR